MIEAIVSPLLGKIGSLVGGFVLGILGNILTQRYGKARAEKKTERFQDELENRLQKFRELPPHTPEEAETRREFVKHTVKELSQKIFGDPIPKARTVRREDTKYPPVDCKWCWEQVHPTDGAEGRCADCALPLCYWIDRSGPRQLSRVPPKLTVVR